MTRSVNECSAGKIIECLRFYDKCAIPKRPRTRRMLSSTNGKLFSFGSGLDVCIAFVSAVNDSACTNRTNRTVGRHSVLIVLSDQ